MSNRYLEDMQRIDLGYIKIQPKKRMPQSQVSAPKPRPNLHIPEFDLPVPKPKYKPSE